MPKVTSFYPAQMYNSWCKETFNGNLIINGTYHDSATLAPRLGRFDYSGIQYDALNNLAQYQPSNAHFEPRSQFHLTRGQNWNMPYGGCWYYATGMGKLTTSLRDTQMHNRQYYLHLGKDHVNTWTGGLPGWGYVMMCGNMTNLNYFTINVYTDPGDEGIMNVYFTNQGVPAGFMFANTIVAGTALNANVQANSASTLGQIYRWNYCPYTSATGSTGGSGASNMFNFIPNQTTVSGFQPLQRDQIYQNAGVTSNGYGTSSASRHVQMLTFTSNLVYFIEHTLSATVGTGNENTTNVFFVKKMTYTGTETTVISLPQWMYGLKLPTQMLNETANTANVIFPYFNTVTANATYGNISLMRLDISKVLNTESISLMAITNSPGQRMYNVAGIQTNLTNVSTYNDVFWRYHAMARTWIVNGPSGQNYLMLSFENTGYSFASYNNNNLNVFPQVAYAQTALNDVGQATRRNEFFRIWAFTVDANYTSAVYQAETDFGNNYPRWYYPIRSDGMQQYMSVMDSQVTDRVIQFSESTYKWSIINTLPYRADIVGLDGNSRIWVSSAYGTHPTTGYGLTNLYLESNVLPQSVTIAPFANTYTYSGGNITTNISVSTTNIFGNLVAANVLVSLTGGMVFANGTTSAYIATSNSSVVTANTLVVSTAPINITGTISGFI